MDTGTHFVMGIGLFALAHLDPVVTAHAETTQAIALGTIIGSQAPDSDTLYRFSGNPTYIRNHRGWTHSLPMLLIWPTVISACIHLVLPSADFLHLFLWTLLAVIIHVFIDLFNTYGTQAFRPFSKRWISWDIINIFDPFIFTSHLAGFLLWWLFPSYPGQIFAALYLLLICYLLWRTWVHRRLLQWVKEKVQEPGEYKVTPTYQPNVWNVVLKQKHRVKMGEIRRKQLLWTGQLKLDQYDHPAVQASKKAEAIDAFLSFTDYGFPLVKKQEYGYEVRWIDVRYHHKRHFPFFAVALLDHKYQMINAYVGWLSQDQLEKKIKKLLTTQLENHGG